MEYTITLRGGETYRCAGSETALGGMLRLGRRGIPVGCRGGGCGVCKVRVVACSYTSDKVSRACISEADEAEGITLACRIHPTSDLALEVLGKMRRGLDVPREAAAPHR